MLFSKKSTVALMVASPSVSCGAVGTSANQLTDEEKAAGWRLLFDGKTTKGWRSFKKASFPAQGYGRAQLAKSQLADAASKTVDRKLDQRSWGLLEGLRTAVKAKP